MNRSFRRTDFLVEKNTLKLTGRIYSELRGKKKGTQELSKNSLQVYRIAICTAYRKYQPQEKTERTGVLSSKVKDMIFKLKREKKIQLLQRAR